MALFSRGTLSLFHRLRVSAPVRFSSWTPWKKDSESSKQNPSVMPEEKVTDKTITNEPDPRTGQPRAWSNWDYSTELSALARRIGYSIETLPSLQTALTDRPLFSKVGFHEKPPEHSRLAVLGRATLKFYVHESLFYTFPKLEGSMLVDLGNYLTNDTALCKLADYLGVVDLIKTERVLNSGSNAKFISSILSSVVGAVYENQGPGSARSFVHNFIVSQLGGKNIQEVIKLEHPRFMLQSILKEQGLPRAESRLVKESGRSTHFPTFQVAVFTGERLLGEGHGSSIKRAEREALLTALMSQFNTQLANVPLPSDSDPGFTPEKELNLNRQTSKTSQL